MKKKYADRWVAALRSGEYKQGRNRLKSGNGYCCLGVLSDLYKGDVGAEWNDRCFSTDTEAEDFKLPNSIKKFVGCKSTGTERSWTSKLAGMNDGQYIDGEWQQPKSFAEIADVIEKEYRKI